MYKGYCIDFKGYELSSNIIQTAVNFAENIDKETSDFLENFLIENYQHEFFVDTLDGDMLANIFFPSDKPFQVFLSHSHSDMNIVNYVAYLLDNMGINVFVDSHVWLNMDDLLEKIDKKYCRIRKNTYSYNKRNISTSNIHMLLFSALQKMIDECECFIFINTTNSLQEAAKTASTFSPWIMGELLTSSIIRRRKPKRKLHESRAGMEGMTLDSMPSISYSARIEHLIPVSCYDFLFWCRDRYDNYEEALDALYREFPGSLR